MRWDGKHPCEMSDRELDSADEYTARAILKHEQHLALLRAGYQELCDEQTRRLRHAQARAH